AGLLSTLNALPVFILSGILLSFLFLPGEADIVGAIGVVVVVFLVAWTFWEYWRQKRIKNKANVIYFSVLSGEEAGEKT
ncbi:MAG: hypothetical protein Q7J30_00540, partial [Candidatus Azambacteria bacterium]|nr:hypothetical protein [Candidatus Azambacteria bacterium]